jgi:hypothetical protein
MPSTSKAKKSAAILVLVSFLVSAAPALADCPFPCMKFEPEEVLLGLVVVLGEAYLIGGGATVAVGNLVYASRHEPSTSGWRYQGYVLGGLNVVIGGLMLGFGIRDDNQGLTGIGAAQLGIGLADLGFTIWSSCQPGEPGRRVALQPLVFPDREGGAAVGVGLTVAGW